MPTRTPTPSNFKAVLLAAVMLAGLVAPFPAGAAKESLTKDLDQLESLDAEILSIEERIPQLEKQIKDTDAKQRETAKKIAGVRGEADRLRPRLEATAREHRAKMDALKDAVQIDYQAWEDGPVELAIESGTISETLSRSNYRIAIGERLDRLAAETAAAEDELREQKDQLDGTVSSLEVLQRQQQAFEDGVRHQRAELAELLANRENESEYLREKIAEAVQVRERLLAEILRGEFDDGEAVKRGDIIGFEGSTGFSTGCHTHFSVINSGQWSDPAKYWQVLRRPDGKLTQPFGMTDWARSGAYGGNIHNGIDVVQGCGNPVRAAADGVVIRDVRDDGSGFGHYVMILHDDDLVTLYGHLI